MSCKRSLSIYILTNTVHLRARLKDFDIVKVEKNVLIQLAQLFYEKVNTAYFLFVRKLKEQENNNTLHAIRDRMGVLHSNPNPHCPNLFGFLFHYNLDITHKTPSSDLLQKIQQYLVDGNMPTIPALDLQLTI